MRDNGWSVSEKPKHNGVAYGHENGRAFAITVSIKRDYVTITGETPFNNRESYQRAPSSAMWSDRFRIVGALAIPLVMVLLAGCGGMSEDEARNEVHERVDKLAERIGTSPTVHGDGP